MQSSEAFRAALRKWTEVLMGRSMHSLMLHAKETGLSMVQFGALMRIHRQGAPAVSDISQQMGVTNAATSQMLERLVQQGLISRSEDPHDRRAKQIALTPHGQAVLDAGLQARQKWLDDLAELLTPAEQDQIAAALQLLADKAAQLEAVPPPHP